MENENKELKCEVCGDKASGVHYRVLSCEGCKGFWRRTIQKGMTDKYTCKVWTDDCEVNKESRGRCQRCRYLACKKAGMIPDLVMSDKERVSRIRLVDSNRDRRTREAGITSSAQSEKEKEKMEADTRLLDLLRSLHTQLLVPTQGQDLGQVTLASQYWVEQLMFNLMGQRDMSDVVATASPEIAILHLVTTRPDELIRIPMMAELSVMVSTLLLSPSEIVLLMAMAALRPRLTWPLALGQEMTKLWDLVMGTVSRTVNLVRLTPLMQVAHSIQAITSLGQGPQQLLPHALPPPSLPPMAYSGQVPGYPPMTPGYPTLSPPGYPPIMATAPHLSPNHFPLSPNCTPPSMLTPSLSPPAPFQAPPPQAPAQVAATFYGEMVRL